MWYSPEKTSVEMAKETGIKQTTIISLLTRHKLPFKRMKSKCVHRDPIRDGWYDESKTIAEMATISGIPKSMVRDTLIRKGLTYKAEKPTTPEWYSADKTVRDMMRDSKKAEGTIRSFLSRTKLPYIKDPRKTFVSECTYEEFLRFYYEGLTVNEMHLISGIKKSSIKSYLSKHKLPYTKVVNSYTVGSWYNQEKTIKEMEYDSGLSFDTIMSIIRSRKLPYKKVKPELKYAIK